MVMLRCWLSNLNLSGRIPGEHGVIYAYISSVFKALGTHEGDLPALESSEWFCSTSAVVPLTERALN